MKKVVTTCEGEASFGKIKVRFVCDDIGDFDLGVNRDKKANHKHRCDAVFPSGIRPPFYGISDDIYVTECQVNCLCRCTVQW